MKQKKEVLTDDIFLTIMDPFRVTNKHYELSKYNYIRYEL